MNNCFSCECLRCGNEFVIGVPDLLDENPEELIGDIVWCGVCDSHDYQCFWGLFLAGTSTDTIAEVLRIWLDWANAYRKTGGVSNAPYGNDNISRT